MAKEVLEMEIKSNTKEVTKDVGKLGKATNAVSGGVKKLGVSFGSLFKAVGVVALLNKAFEVLQEVFMKNQKVVDIFNTGMTALSIAFNDLFSYIGDNVGAITGFFKEIFENPAERIQELGTTIKEGLIDRFNEFVEVLGLAGKAFGQLIDGKFSAAFDTIKEAGKEVVDVYTGVDGSFEKVAETVTNYTKKVWKQAEAITATNKAAARAAVEFAKLNAQYLREAEIQRQARDDVNKSFAERIEANTKLSEILNKQQELQKEQIQLQVDAAQAQYNINASEENYIALKEQEVAMLELLEAIDGQRSEQLTNQTALQNELRDAQLQTQLEGLSGVERELAELKIAHDEKIRLAKQAGMKTAAITKQFEGQKAKIVADGVATQLSAYSGLTGALGQLAGDNKALALATAVIDTYAAANSVLKDPTLVGPARWASAAAVIATGLANVSTIMKTEVPGGGGGGGGGSAPTTPAPQMMSGQFQLGAGIEPEATRAYVVTDEMTNSQNQLANIRRRATI